MKNASSPKSYNNESGFLIVEENKNEEKSFSQNKQENDAFQNLESQKSKMKIWIEKKYIHSQSLPELQNEEDSIEKSNKKIVFKRDQLDSQKLEPVETSKGVKDSNLNNGDIDKAVSKGKLQDQRKTKEKRNIQDKESTKKEVNEENNLMKKDRLQLKILLPFKTIKAAEHFEESNEMGEETNNEVIENTRKVVKRGKKATNTFEAKK